LGQEWLSFAGIKHGCKMLKKWGDTKLKSFMPILISTIIFFNPYSNISAEILKCIDSEGTVMYTDSICPEGYKAEKHMHEIGDRNVYESSDEKKNDIAKEKQIFGKTLEAIDNTLETIKTCEKLLKKRIKLYDEQKLIIRKEVDTYLSVLDDEINGRPSVTNKRRLEEIETESKSIGHELSLIQAQYEKLGCSAYY
jgi:peptidoglycan hydrolase CwlO-like protein